VNDLPESLVSEPRIAPGAKVLLRRQVPAPKVAMAPRAIGKWADDMDIPTHFALRIRALTNIPVLVSAEVEAIEGENIRVRVLDQTLAGTELEPGQIVLAPARDVIAHPDAESFAFSAGADVSAGTDGRSIWRQFDRAVDRLAPETSASAGELRRSALAEAAMLLDLPDPGAIGDPAAFDAAAAAAGLEPPAVALALGAAFGTIVGAARAGAPERLALSAGGIDASGWGTPANALRIFANHAKWSLGEVRQNADRPLSVAFSPKAAAAIAVEPQAGTGDFLVLDPLRLIAGEPFDRAMLSRHPSLPDAVLALPGARDRRLAALAAACDWSNDKLSSEAAQLRYSAGIPGIRTIVSTREDVDRILAARGHAGDIVFDGMLPRSERVRLMAALPPNRRGTISVDWSGTQAVGRAATRPEERGFGPAIMARWSAGADPDETPGTKPVAIRFRSHLPNDYMRLQHLGWPVPQAFRKSVEMSQQARERLTDVASRHEGVVPLAADAANIWFETESLDAALDAARDMLALKTPNLEPFAEILHKHEGAAPGERDRILLIDEEFVRTGMCAQRLPGLLDEKDVRQIPLEPRTAEQWADVLRYATLFNLNLVPEPLRDHARLELEGSAMRERQAGPYYPNVKNPLVSNAPVVMALSTEFIEDTLHRSIGAGWSAQKAYKAAQRSTADAHKALSEIAAGDARLTGLGVFPSNPSNLWFEAASLDDAVDAVQAMLAAKIPNVRPIAQLFVPVEQGRPDERRVIAVTDSELARSGIAFRRLDPALERAEVITVDLEPRTASQWADQLRYAGREHVEHVPADLRSEALNGLAVADSRLASLAFAAGASMFDEPGYDGNYGVTLAVPPRATIGENTFESFVHEVVGAALEPVRAAWTMGLRETETIYPVSHVNTNADGSLTHWRFNDERAARSVFQALQNSRALELTGARIEAGDFSAMTKPYAWFAPRGTVRRPWLPAPWDKNHLDVAPEIPSLNSGRLVQTQVGPAGLKPWRIVQDVSRLNAADRRDFITPDKAPENLQIVELQAWEVPTLDREASLARAGAPAVGAYDPDYTALLRSPGFVRSQSPFSRVSVPYDPQLVADARDFTPFDSSPVDPLTRPPSEKAETYSLRWSAGDIAGYDGNYGVTLAVPPVKGRRGDLALNAFGEAVSGILDRLSASPDWPADETVSPVSYVEEPVNGAIAHWRFNHADPARALFDACQDSPALAQIGVRIEIGDHRAMAEPYVWFGPENHSSGRPWAVAAPIVGETPSLTSGVLLQTVAGRYGAETGGTPAWRIVHDLDKFDAVGRQKIVAPERDDLRCVRIAIDPDAVPTLDREASLRLAGAPLGIAYDPEATRMLREPGVFSTSAMPTFPSRRLPGLPFSFDLIADAVLDKQPAFNNTVYGVAPPARDRGAWPLRWSAGAVPGGAALFHGNDVLALLDGAGQPLRLIADENGLSLASGDARVACPHIDAATIPEELWRAELDAMSPSDRIEIPVGDALTSALQAHLRAGGDLAVDIRNSGRAFAVGAYAAPEGAAAERTQATISLGKMFGMAVSRAVRRPQPEISRANIAIDLVLGAAAARSDWTTARRMVDRTIQPILNANGAAPSADAIAIAEWTALNPDLDMRWAGMSPKERVGLLDEYAAARSRAREAQLQFSAGVAARPAAIAALAAAVTLAPNVARSEIHELRSVFGSASTIETDKAKPGIALQRDRNGALEARYERQPDGSIAKFDPANRRTGDVVANGNGGYRLRENSGLVLDLTPDGAGGYDIRIGAGGARVGSVSPAPSGAALHFSAGVSVGNAWYCGTAQMLDEQATVAANIREAGTQIDPLSLRIASGERTQDGSFIRQIDGPVERERFLHEIAAIAARDPAVPPGRALVAAGIDYAPVFNVVFDQRGFDRGQAPDVNAVLEAGYPFDYIRPDGTRAETMLLYGWGITMPSAAGPSPEPSVVLLDDPRPGDLVDRLDEDRQRFVGDLAARLRPLYDAENVSDEQIAAQLDHWSRSQWPSRDVMRLMMEQVAESGRLGFWARAEAAASGILPWKRALLGSVFADHRAEAATPFREPAQRAAEVGPIVGPAVRWSEADRGDTWYEPQNGKTCDGRDVRDADKSISFSAGAEGERNMVRVADAAQLETMLDELFDYATGLDLTGLDNEDPGAIPLAARVGGDLKVRASQVGALPEGMVIAGDFVVVAEDATPKIVLPKNFVVRGTIVADGTTIEQPSKPFISRAHTTEPGAWEYDINLNAPREAAARVSAWAVENPAQATLAAMMLGGAVGAAGWMAARGTIGFSAGAASSWLEAPEGQRLAFANQALAAFSARESAPRVSFGLAEFERREALLETLEKAARAFSPDIEPRDLAALALAAGDRGAALPGSARGFARSIDDFAKADVMIEAARSRAVSFSAGSTEREDARKWLALTQDQRAAAIGEIVEARREMAKAIDLKDPTQAERAVRGFGARFAEVAGRLGLASTPDSFLAAASVVHAPLNAAVETAVELSARAAARLDRGLAWSAGAMASKSAAQPVRKPQSELTGELDKFLFGIGAGVAVYATAIAGKILAQNGGFSSLGFSAGASSDADIWRAAEPPARAMFAQRVAALVADYRPTDPGQDQAAFMRGLQDAAKPIGIPVGSGSMVGEVIAEFVGRDAAPSAFEAAFDRAARERSGGPAFAAGVSDDKTLTFDPAELRGLVDGALAKDPDAKLGLTAHMGISLLAIRPDGKRRDDTLPLVYADQSNPDRMGDLDARRVKDEVWGGDDGLEIFDAKIFKEIIDKGWHPVVVLNPERLAIAPMRAGDHAIYRHFSTRLWTQDPPAADPGSVKLSAGVALTATSRRTLDLPLPADLRGIEARADRPALVLRLPLEALSKSDVIEAVERAYYESQGAVLWRREDKNAYLVFPAVQADTATDIAAVFAKSDIAALAAIRIEPRRATYAAVESELRRLGMSAANVAELRDGVPAPVERPVRANALTRAFRALVSDTRVQTAAVSALAASAALAASHFAFAAGAPPRDTLKGPRWQFEIEVPLQRDMTPAERRELLRKIDAVIKPHNAAAVGFDEDGRVRVAAFSYREASAAQEAIRKPGSIDGDIARYLRFAVHCDAPRFVDPGNDALENADIVFSAAQRAFIADLHEISRRHNVWIASTYPMGLHSLSPSDANVAIDAGVGPRYDFQPKVSIDRTGKYRYGKLAFDRDVGVETQIRTLGLAPSALLSAQPADVRARLLEMDWKHVLDEDGTWRAITAAQYADDLGARCLARDRAQSTHTQAQRMAAAIAELEKFGLGTSLKFASGIDISIAVAAAARSDMAIDAFRALTKAAVPWLDDFAVAIAVQQALIDRWRDAGGIERPLEEAWRDMSLDARSAVAKDHAALMSVVARATAHSDLDSAAKDIQDVYGVTTGDLGGVFFSGALPHRRDDHRGPDGKSLDADAAWPRMTRIDRFEQLVRYAGEERRARDDLNKGMAFAAGALMRDPGYGFALRYDGFAAVNAAKSVRAYDLSYQRMAEEADAIAAREGAAFDDVDLNRRQYIAPDLATAERAIRALESAVRAQAEWATAMKISEKCDAPYKLPPRARELPGVVGRADAELAKTIGFDAELRKAEERFPFVFVREAGGAIYFAVHGDGVEKFFRPSMTRLFETIGLDKMDAASGDGPDVFTLNGIESSTTVSGFSAFHLAPMPAPFHVSRSIFDELEAPGHLLESFRDAVRFAAGISSSANLPDKSEISTMERNAGASTQDAIIDALESSGQYVRREKAAEVAQARSGVISDIAQGRDTAYSAGAVAADDDGELDIGGDDDLDSPDNRTTAPLTAVSVVGATADFRRTLEKIASRAAIDVPETGALRFEFGMPDLADAFVRLAADGKPNDVRIELAAGTPTDAVVESDLELGYAANVHALATADTLRAVARAHGLDKMPFDDRLATVEANVRDWLGAVDSAKPSAGELRNALAQDFYKFVEPKHQLWEADGALRGYAEALIQFRANPESIEAAAKLRDAYSGVLAALPLPARLAALPKRLTHGQALAAAGAGAVGLAAAASTAMLAYSAGRDDRESTPLPSDWPNWSSDEKLAYRATPYILGASALAMTLGGTSFVVSQLGADPAKAEAVQRGLAQLLNISFSAGAAEPSVTLVNFRGRGVDRIALSRAIAVERNGESAAFVVANDRASAAIEEGSRRAPDAQIASIEIPLTGAKALADQAIEGGSPQAQALSNAAAMLAPLSAPPASKLQRYAQMASTAATGAAGLGIVAGTAYLAAPVLWRQAVGYNKAVDAKLPLAEAVEALRAAGENTQALFGAKLEAAKLLQADALAKVEAHGASADALLALERATLQHAELMRDAAKHFNDALLNLPNLDSLLADPYMQAAVRNAIDYADPQAIANVTRGVLDAIDKVQSSLIAGPSQTDITNFPWEWDHFATANQADVASALQSLHDAQTSFKSAAFELGRLAPSVDINTSARLWDLAKEAPVKLPGWMEQGIDIANTAIETLRATIDSAVGRIDANIGSVGDVGAKLSAFAQSHAAQMTANPSGYFEHLAHSAYGAGLDIAANAVQVFDGARAMLGFSAGAEPLTVLEHQAKRALDVVEKVVDAIQASEEGTSVDNIRSAFKAAREIADGERVQSRAYVVTVGGPGHRPIADRLAGELGAVVYAPSRERLADGRDSWSFATEALAAAFAAEAKLAADGLVPGTAKGVEIETARRLSMLAPAQLEAEENLLRYVRHVTASKNMLVDAVLRNHDKTGRALADAHPSDYTYDIAVLNRAPADIDLALIDASDSNRVSIKPQSTRDLAVAIARDIHTSGAHAQGPNPSVLELRARVPFADRAMAAWSQMSAKERIGAIAAPIAGLGAAYGLAQLSFRAGAVPEHAAWRLGVEIVDQTDERTIEAVRAAIAKAGGQIEDEGNGDDPKAPRDIGAVFGSEGEAKAVGQALKAALGDAINEPDVSAPDAARAPVKADPARAPAPRAPAGREPDGFFDLHRLQNALAELSAQTGHRYAPIATLRMGMRDEQTQQRGPARLYIDFKPAQETGLTPPPTLRVQAGLPGKPPKVDFVPPRGEANADGKRRRTASPVVDDPQALAMRDAVSTVVNLVYEQKIRRADAQALKTELARAAQIHGADTVKLGLTDRTDTDNKNRAREEAEAFSFRAGAEPARRAPRQAQAPSREIPTRQIRAASQAPARTSARAPEPKRDLSDLVVVAGPSPAEIEKVQALVAKYDTARLQAAARVAADLLALKTATQATDTTVVEAREAVKRGAQILRVELERRHLNEPTLDEALGVGKAPSAAAAIRDSADKRARQGRQNDQGR